jgi:uncharacterized protein (TIRG00374 family)
MRRMLVLIPEKFRDRVKNIGKSFLDSLNFISNKKILIKVFSISAIIWFNTLLAVFLITSGLNIHLPLHYYFFIIAGGTFGMLIPSTSGSIGVYHTVSMSIMILLGVNKDVSLSYAIISHSYDFFPNIALGCIMFFINYIKKLNKIIV